MESEKLFADVLFDAFFALSNAEEELNNRAHRWTGADPDEPDTWKFGHAVHDYYDRSFELRDAQNDLKLSEDIQREAHALGFVQCWICHQDGSETFYSFRAPGPGHWKKEGLGYRLAKRDASNSGGSDG